MNLQSADKKLEITIGLLENKVLKSYGIEYNLGDIKQLWGDSRAAHYETI